MVDPKVSVVDGLRGECLIANNRLFAPQLAWVLMECPNLVAVVYFYFKNYTPGTFPPATNCVLLAFYTGHYINRSLIFPLRMKGGKVR